jgi:hypothetical protein
VDPVSNTAIKQLKHVQDRRIEAAADEGITAVGAQREGNKFDATVCDQWQTVGI